MSNKALLEVAANKVWMALPSFVHAIRRQLETNYVSIASFEKTEKTAGYVTATDRDGSKYFPEEYQISEDGKSVCSRWALEYEGEQQFPFVSVLTIDGPITRDGGGCSYGSKDHRDMMIKAANHPLCRGHLFIINTPGGTAWAKNDYEQAIEYARSLGQPVIAFIDGRCCSAGMYLAALCDERYYMHPKDIIGCIGVMAAFYTQADGSENQFTGETYHELYDPESPEKNKAYRDIANDNDAEELIKELAALGVEFRSDVKKHCPAAKAEHLRGKVFDAEEVKGILVDGQSTFLDCVKRAFDLYNGKATPVNREMPAEEPDEDEDNEDGGEDTSNSCKPKKSISNENHTTINMQNYQLINAACGLVTGEIATTEEGAFMNAGLLDALETHLSAQEQQIAELTESCSQHQEAIEAAVANANAEHSAAIDTLNSEHASAIEALNTEHASALEALNAEHASEVERLNAQIAALTAEKDQAEASLRGAQEALATAEQTIHDRDAQIQELSNEPGSEPAQGNSPENNGDGAQTQELKSGMPKFDPANPVESKAAIDAYLANIRNR